MRQKKSVVLITVSGQDRPGITSELTGILAEGEVSILDIGQAVIHGLLSLSILFELESGTDDKNLLKELLFRANELGLKLEFQVMDPKLADQNGHLTPKAYHYAVTLIAERVGAQSLHEVTHVLSKHKVNIDVIERLSEGEFSCVEMLVSSAEELNRRALKKELLAIAKKQGVDIALQAEGLYRRAKRLVVLDMDSTLIQGEVIDEFAREHGVYDEVAAVTEQAMKGKITFDDAFRMRVEKLKGLSTDQIEKVFRRI